LPSLIEQQIELEKKMTDLSVEKYRREYERAKQSGQLGTTSAATRIMVRIIEPYSTLIKQYIGDYTTGKAVTSTIAAHTIKRLNDVDTVAYIAAKTIINTVMTKMSIQAVYKAIGQAIEDEYKMREFKNENSHYYKTIQTDLNQRGAKANRKKNITTGVFNKRLDFHLDRWTITEKFHAGMVLTNIFIEATGLVEFEDVFKKKRHYKYLIPTPELLAWIENINDRLEVMQPLFLPMVCPPKDWTGVLEGGYISPYLKRNKLVKNNSKEYLKKLETASMPMVYEAINHLQATQWQVNKKVLDVVKALWEEGRAIAELPDREDEPLIPFPYPDRARDTVWNSEEVEVIKKWKRDTYEIHKRNVQKRSIRLLVSQIIRIAVQFEGYESIYFPYQMDFRGRLYPIPVLLQPQGSDLAKGLLHFAQGKPVDKDSVKWLQIHGANVYGYDKESYEKRVLWVQDHRTEIQSYAENPLENRGWAEADKPFQFLAFCFEYNSYLNAPDSFKTHIPVQLDGTCNGLQHYSALLRDEVGGRAVNLLNSEKPHDIYATVAKKLEEKLNVIKDSDNSDDSLRSKVWLALGINRKLTKRPVMVLPYGGTMLSCREYITEYLTDNYSPNFIWQQFGVGENPTDCTFKVSCWLSKHLWKAIQDTLKSAIVGMDYLKKVARVVIKQQQYIEWLTPVGLLVRQAYKSRKNKEIRTELFGKIMKTNVNIDIELSDSQRQLNGICPNFIHSLDAACLMLYIIKCKQAGIEGFMTVHDCYGTYAGDTEMSAKLLRESFVEIYRQPILENFTQDVLSEIMVNEADLPQLPERGSLDIEEVLKSDYFFN
jgi:DNA-directed RNA polymerase